VVGIWEIVGIVVAVVIVGLLVWLAKVKKVESARATILKWVNDVEAKYGTGTGDIKYVEVVGLIYEWLPLYWHLVFTKKFIDFLIEEAVKIMKKTFGEKRIQAAVGLIPATEENLRKPE